MTHTKTLIESAVRGGYGANKHFISNLPEYAQCQMWIDPSFWRAVGKDQGWDTKKPKTYWHKTTESVMKAGGLQVGKLKDEITILDKTECVIHDMLDHLCNVGDIESFAKSLNLK